MEEDYYMSDDGSEEEEEEDDRFSCDQDAEPLENDDSDAQWVPHKTPSSKVWTAFYVCFRECAFLKLLLVVSSFEFG